MLVGGAVTPEFIRGSLDRSLVSSARITGTEEGDELLLNLAPADESFLGFWATRGDLADLIFAEWQE